MDISFLFLVCGLAEYNLDVLHSMCCIERI